MIIFWIIFVNFSFAQDGDEVLKQEMEQYEKCESSGTSYEECGAKGCILSTHPRDKCFSPIKYCADDRKNDCQSNY